MISKKVGISPKSDNYARLASYIADAAHKGEKSLMHWCAGCLGDDDYQNGIAEAVDVQAMNTRSRQSKTYHLVISFRPEAEAKLTPEVFRAIEERFAASLGYTEHQRHCGVHKNTANFHMHIAYNMIHPEKHTRHEPFRDYWTRDGICRELEREYSLAVDNGRAKDKQRSLGEKAALVEAHTGQQSFESYAKAHKDKILLVLAAATDWQTFTLPGGGRILDSGKELFFSGNDDTARHIAFRYAQKKWGKSLHIEGNKIVRLEIELEKDQNRKQQQTMER